MTTSAASLPAALMPRQVLNWFGVAPFFIFATLFLILPTFNIVFGAFRNTDGQVTLENLGKLFEPSIRSAFWISIELSLLTAVLGSLFGFLIAAAITLGRLGFVTMPLRNWFGINLYGSGFSIVSFLGPSGCDKTTVLRMVAGFETPTSGSIVIDGRDVTGIAANRRRIAMVFQAYALFPNLTVEENVGFGLEVAGEGKADIASRVGEMLELIGLRQFGSRYPVQFSGGQQQRVALARPLAPRPQVLLLDEPLSALDAKIRISLREEIRRIQRDIGITAIFVTHDQEEALSMSDRVVVMRQGVADQVGTPFEIYNRPTTRFVAEFVGTLNLLDAAVVEAAAGRIRLSDVPVALNRPLPGRDGDTISLALRPETVALGRVEGRNVVLRGRIADQVVSLDTFNQPERPPPAIGALVEVSISDRDLLVLAA